MDQRERGTDTVEALRTAMEGYAAENLWTSLPGVVKSYNGTNQTVTVQSTLMVQVRNKNGQFSWKTIPPLQDVPVVFPSGSTFGLSWVPQVGDEVLVVFSARCIDNWWAYGYQSATQAQLRLHSLSDGFCIPGPKSKPNAAAVVQPSANAIRLGKLDGTAYVEVNAAGAVNIVAPGGLFINGNAVVHGTVTADGEVIANETTTPIPLSTHLHTGVTSGGANTGVPIP